MEDVRILASKSESKNLGTYLPITDFVNNVLFNSRSEQLQQFEIIQVHFRNRHTF